MRYINVASSILVLAMCLGCSFGNQETSTNNSNNPSPVVTTYGIFRDLHTQTTSNKSLFESVQPSNLLASRVYHRAILMLNGKVLLVGGDAAGHSPTMDIYDPTTESFTQSAATPVTARYNKVYVELHAYSAFGMCNLPNGTVFICGTNEQAPSHISAEYEIYDPIADTITYHPLPIQIGSINEAYYIGSNPILLITTYSRAWILNLTTGELDSGAESPVTSQAATLQDAKGNVWTIGGESRVPPYWNALISHQNIYKYDINTGTWNLMGCKLKTARSKAMVVLLPNDKIGIYGGESVTLVDPSNNGQNAPTMATELLSVEIYDMLSDTIISSSDLVGERSNAAAVFLQTGYTFIAGGTVDFSVVDTELVHKFSETGPAISGSTGKMLHSRAGHCVTNLPNGLVLVSGGDNKAQETPSVSETAELFDPQAAIYIKYATEEVVVGNVLQLTAYDSSSNPLSVSWAVSKNDCGSIDSNGLLTTTAIGIIEVVATDTVTNNTAIIRIKVIPE